MQRAAVISAVATLVTMMMMKSSLAAVVVGVVAVGVRRDCGWHTLREGER